MRDASYSRERAGAAALKKRILIVEDHPIMRDGLKELINKEPDMEVCGETGDAFAALELAAGANPDLVLVDITIAGKNGLELIKDIHAQFAEMAILALSMHDETLYAERVLRAGGRGYIMKQEGGQQIITAIRQIFAGGIAVSPRVSGKALNLLSGSASDISPVGCLTDRELEIFELIGLGHDNNRIADNLHISPKTVDIHRAHIKEKLRIASTPELISFAARWIEVHGAM
jgi:DNA-binding NarL/FixJ family response regulator